MHRNNFDALRLGAALTVMVSHQFALTGKSEPTPFIGLTLGLYAVFVFFAISGYLVAQSWQRDPDIRRFLLRRMLRIAPAYTVVLAVTPGVMIALGLIDFTGNPRTDINGSLWTIVLEVECYLVFLAAVAFTRHGSIILVVALLYLGTEGLFKQFAGFFALGAMISQYPILRHRFATAAFIVLGLLLLPPLKFYYAIVVILVPLVIAIGNSSWPVLRDVGRYGDISYGVYLYAFPIQQIFIWWLGADTPWMLLFALSVASAAIVGCASWWLVERPALAMKPMRPSLPTHDLPVMPAQVAASMPIADQASGNAAVGGEKLDV